MTMKDGRVYGLSKQGNYKWGGTTCQGFSCFTNPPMWNVIELKCTSGCDNISFKRRTNPKICPWKIPDMTSISLPTYNNTCYDN